MGQKTCGMCHGSGTNLKRSTCGRCGGDGKVTCECRATAMSPGEISACAACWGTGERTCRADGCNDGIVPKEITCERCGGGGLVDVPSYA